MRFRQDRKIAAISKSGAEARDETRRGPAQGVDAPARILKRE